MKRKVFKKKKDFTIKIWAPSQIFFKEKKIKKIQPIFDTEFMTLKIRIVRSSSPYS